MSLLVVLLLITAAAVLALMHAHWVLWLLLLVVAGLVADARSRP